MNTYWQGRRVLVTGHSGFKGAWLSHWLLIKGSEVHGLALVPDTKPALFEQLGLSARLDHALGDIRDRSVVRSRIDSVKPDVIFHLAAQPFVRRSYLEPVETFATNVMGTAHVLEAVRESPRPIVVVVITTDKVYENREWVHGYRETDRLGGHDPYSASKAACELLVDSYRKSFFQDGRVRVGCARAGNVIGGGDWANDRLVPDFVRAAIAGATLSVRSPQAVRPWQHVLDPLAGYIILAERLAEGMAQAASSFNFGPDATGQRSVSDVLDEASLHWSIAWRGEPSSSAAMHEASRLSLATDKARNVLGWAPRWEFKKAVEETTAWYRAVQDGADPVAVTTEQIRTFEKAPAR
jgi:CDP-glucose 4,6-dehydratase